jgi:hypothetical protein
MSDISEKFVKKQRAFDLAKCYRNEFISRGYGYKIFSMSNVEESRWWQYFIEAVDLFSTKEEYDPYLFIRSMFDEYGKVYPHAIVRKKTWENYIAYLPAYTKNEDEFKSEVVGLVSDYKKVKKLMLERDIKTYEDFFNNLFVRELIRRGSFSNNLFIFMRQYYKNYSTIYNTDENLKETFERFQIRRLKFLKNEKVKQAIKKMLGEEMI